MKAAAARPALTAVVVTLAPLIAVTLIQVSCFTPTHQPFYSLTVSQASLCPPLSIWPLMQTTNQKL